MPRGRMAALPIVGQRATAAITDKLFLPLHISIPKSQDVLLVTAQALAAFSEAPAAGRSP